MNNEDDLATEDLPSPFIIANEPESVPAHIVRALFSKYVFDDAWDEVPVLTEEMVEHEEN